MESRTLATGPYDRVVRAVFAPVTKTALDRLLLFQSRLYASESIPFDPVRARASAEWLLAHPDAGAAWLIESDGRSAGYLVVTVCVSLEFHGRFALLDELFLDEPFRTRGLGRQAVEFAAQWAASRGMHALRLEASEENAPALALYRKSGFVDHGRHILTKWLAN
jgi:diamine N-acetyltransferase